MLTGDRADASRFDSVVVDSERGAYEATRHLIATGRTRIAGLNCKPGDTPADVSKRTHGYLSALRDNGIAAVPELTVGPIPWKRTAGAEAIARLLDAGTEFDAVFAMNDALALGALSELQARGLAVPGDVAVVGFDNVEEARYSTPPLTTVDSGRNWVASKAVELLLARCAGEPASQGPVMEVAEHRLIVRATA